MRRGKMLLIIIAIIWGMASVAIGAEKQKVIRWRFQSIWPPAINLIEGDKHFVGLVNKLAGGRLKIDFYPGGALVGGFELFDAVAKGTIEAGGDWPNYWAGKNTAFDLLGSFPMLLTPGDYFVWIWQGGGLELYQEIYGKYGLVYFPHTNTSMESGVRSNKPIRTLKDYAGLKIRMSGRNQGKILKDIGAAQVMMAGGEIYQALERGVIDAAEFCNPSTDWGMGFQEVTKYWASPGWHQPNSVLGVMINKKAWDALPDDLKYIIKVAAQATFTWSWSFFEYSAIDGTKKFLEKGIKLTRLDDDSLKKLQELAWKHLLEDARANPDFAKVAYSQVKFLHDFAHWRTICKPFSFGRNPKGLEKVLKELETLVKGKK
ncbi:ABC transporter substrate-binding protein [Candidatus Bathyarchaeota archaeon]|nr:MAG: ABC transporter substrate-binding protein [Deltaproteobacteria bacterium]RLG90637.1 MAG: ABC transporter substrate-binding protein [Candidatus Bathyarchaeota archaeon]